MTALYRKLERQLRNIIEQSKTQDFIKINKAVNELRGEIDIILEMELENKYLQEYEKVSKAIGKTITPDNYFKIMRPMIDVLKDFGDALKTCPPNILDMLQEESHPMFEVPESLKEHVKNPKQKRD